MKKMSPSQSELQNFHWHCDVAALLIRTFPLQPAVRSNLARAVSVMQPGGPMKGNANPAETGTSSA
jgi:hypothetical protein